MLRRIEKGIRCPLVGLVIETLKPLDVCEQCSNNKGIKDNQVDCDYIPPETISIEEFIANNYKFKLVNMSENVCYKCCFYSNLEDCCNKPRGIECYEGQMWTKHKL
ncbi:MAG: hypothetical protein RSE41_00860 [Clostridia bacterium]